MKKKLLLIALPALMALSGCANIQQDQPRVEQEQPAPAVEAVEFEEDTVAHEEIFGEAVEAKQPTIRKMSELDDEPAYKIGYQLHYDSVADKLSIRFIAAIKTTYTSKVWSRGISTVAGVETKAFGNKRTDGTTPLASSVYYTSLSNGGSDVMRAGEGDYSSYTSFIVYSITNIPYASNKDSYIGVSLLLDDVQTDFYAVKIETNNEHTVSTDIFTLSSEKEGYFLKGTFAGSANPYVPADTEKVGTNRARFTLNLAADDSFVIINRGNDGSKFQYWNSSCIDYDDNDDILTDFQNNSGEIKAKNPAKYALFLNNDNPTAKLYRHKYAQTTGFYVRGAAAGDGWSTPKASYQFFSCPNEDGNQGELLNVHLDAGDFKIATEDWNKEWGYYHYKNGGYSYPNEGNEYYSIVCGGAASNFDHEDGEGKNHGVVNIKCKVAGNYNIFVTAGNFVSFELAA